MITVITEDARYDFEAETWTVGADGRLEVWKDGAATVATFAAAKWHGVFDSGQLVPSSLPSP